MTPFALTSPSQFRPPGPPPLTSARYAHDLAQVQALGNAAGHPRGQQRQQLLAQLEAGTDARAERYWQLLGIINGWPAFPAHVPAFEWLIGALRAHS